MEAFVIVVWMSYMMVIGEAMGIKCFPMPLELDGFEKYLGEGGELIVLAIGWMWTEGR